MTLIPLSSLDGLNGFRLTGQFEYDELGISGSSLGDINGDGFDDVIIGASYSDAGGVYAGTAYVVFGGQTFSATQSAGDVGTTVQGFQLVGEAFGDGAG